MHHNLTRETIPIRSTGVLTVRLTDSAAAPHLDPSLDSLALTRAHDSALPDVLGEACPVAAWRSGTTTQTRMAPAFPSPVTTTGCDSLNRTRLP